MADHNIQSGADERLVLIHGFSREETIAVMRAAKIAVSDPQGVAFTTSTPTNLDWRLRDLIAEVREEHEYMRNNPPGNPPGSAAGDSSQGSSAKPPGSTPKRTPGKPSNSSQDTAPAGKSSPQRQPAAESSPTPDSPGAPTDRSR